MKRKEKWAYDFLWDLHSPEKLNLLKHDYLLTRWNMMNRKPNEEQILRKAELSSRQVRRTNLRTAIDELATTTELKKRCVDFVATLTKDGAVDINDLPVSDRLKLTREGINWLINKPSNWIEE